MKSAPPRASHQAAPAGDAHLRAQSRENPDPHEAVNPVPRLMLVVVTLLIAFSVVYIATTRIDTPSAWGDGRARSELEGAPQTGAVDGAAVYAARCAACHQATGQGLPGVFPPLAGSEWARGKGTTTAAIVLNGINGPITVAGTTFNGSMPSFKSQLDDAQVAAAISYVRRQWGNAAQPVDAATIAAVRAQTRERTAPYAGEKEIPPHD
jgi:mono/diheme cytochrome c family protein